MVIHKQKSQELWYFSPHYWAGEGQFLSAVQTVDRWRVPLAIDLTWPPSEVGDVPPRCSAISEVGHIQRKRIFVTEGERVVVRLRDHTRKVFKEREYINFPFRVHQINEVEGELLKFERAPSFSMRFPNQVVKGHADRGTNVSCE